MRLRTVMALALDALARNKLRSLLTTLGIVIGVAAVVTMQSMGKGATAYVGEAISGLGSNMLIVIPGSARGMTSGAPLFTTMDMDAIRKHVHDAQLVAATRTSPLRAVAGSNNHVTSVLGATPDYLNIRKWSVAQGRTLNQDDERQAALHCVVGQTIVEQLFPGRPALGSELRVRNLPCRVVGVLSAKGGSAFGADQDDIILMPFTTFSRRITGSSRIGAFLVSADSAMRIDSAKLQLGKLLRQRRHLQPDEMDDFTIRDPRELQAVMENVTSMLTTLLAGVAAISLLVGGIGIMNIMLVSVTERTREIGIRLAVGARTYDILMQFLFEAVFLSSVGGLLGIALGMAAARAIAQGIDIPFVIPGSAIPVAFVVSVCVGVLFGVFPARKAARLNPLAALRFE
jgi:putative ABC transport system permease protein